MNNTTIVILAIITAVTIESLVYRICTHIERKQQISQKKGCVK